MTVSELARVYAKDADGVWHRTTATYPSSADTACEVRHKPMVFFRVGYAHGWPTFARPSCRRCRETP